MISHKRNASTKPLLDVLIVEDDSVSRKAMTVLVRRQGYIADSAASAEEGLRKVKEQGAPRILLVDMDLPGMSGLDLIELLETLDTSIFPVLITAAGLDRVTPFLDSHTMGYLQKPLDVSRLFRMLTERAIN